MQHPLVLIPSCGVELRKRNVVGVMLRWERLGSSSCWQLRNFLESAAAPLVWDGSSVKKGESVRRLLKYWTKKGGGGSTLIILITSACTTAKGAVKQGRGPHLETFAFRDIHLFNLHHRKKGASITEGEGSLLSGVDNRRVGLHLEVSPTSTDHMEGPNGEENALSWRSTKLQLT